MKKLLFLLLSLLMIACSPNDSGYSPPVLVVQDAGTDVKTDHKTPAINEGWDTGDQETYPMQYHGGPVMVSENHVYLIWYGDWSNNQKTVDVISDFVSNLGESDWFKITSLYYQELLISNHSVPNQPFTKTKVISFVNNKITLSKSIFVDYPLGDKLTEQDIAAVVASTIFEHKLPLDYNGVYVVLTSQDIAQTMEKYYSFCSDYCGWHYFAPFDKGTIKYAFVGDPARCSFGCSMKDHYTSHNLTHSPNDDWSADGMVSVIAHELAETVTDPNLDAWQDYVLYENADKCAWTFGKVYGTANASAANVIVGSKDYLIQQNWILSDNGGYCGLSK